MDLTLYQADAFTNRLFRGNPAAIVPLERWLPDGVMQAIAAENNLAETAYFVASGERYQLRWFTPAIEVDLCGHATLASAFILYTELGYARPEVVFDTLSGPLTVRRSDGGYAMDFPARPAKPAPTETAARVAAALGATPREVLQARDFLAVFDTEAEVAALRPDMAALAALPCLGTIATAPGDTVDFVSRFFAPGAGVNEDPATGSAHCTSTPYWAKRLGKAELKARQISARTGDLICTDRGDRVSLWGEAALYLRGTIRIPDAALAETS